MIGVTDLSLSQGDFSLKDVNLVVPDGEYGVLMGRSGCGKTTVLEVVCGLRPFIAGDVKVSGRSVGHLKPAERGIGYVPQDRALFPTMRVRDQIAFSLIVRSLYIAHWESFGDCRCVISGTIINNNDFCYVRCLA